MAVVILVFFFVVRSLNTTLHSVVTSIVQPYMIRQPDRVPRESC